MKKTIIVLILVFCFSLFCISVNAYNYNYQTFEIDVVEHNQPYYEVEFWNNTIISAGGLGNGLRAYSYSDEGLVLEDVYNESGTWIGFDMVLDDEGYIYCAGDSYGEGIQIFSPFNNSDDSFNLVAEENTYAYLDGIWTNGSVIFAVKYNFGLLAYRYWKENNTVNLVDTFSFVGIGDGFKGWYVTADDNPGHSDDYVFIGDNSGVFSFTFNENGTDDLYFKHQVIFSGDTQHIEHDGDYFYNSAGPYGIKVYTYNDATGFSSKRPLILFP